MVVKMQVSRWRCLNRKCERARHLRINCRKLFVLTLGGPNRIAELVHLFGHGNSVALVAERLMKRLGMPVSDDTPFCGI